MGLDLHFKATFPSSLASMFFVYLLICFLITGGMDPRCKICIFMGKTDPDAPKHKQQVMVDKWLARSSPRKVAVLP